ncbi:MAG: T9SS type A sorting domain-containing protein [Paludibacter sp.]|nr:T9SS type A sorting domain-containing protein [Paludibacter sp.]
MITFNLSAVIYTFDVVPTVTKDAAPYVAGEIFLSGDICLNQTTTEDDVWFPIIANPSSNGLKYSLKDSETNMAAGKKAVVYKSAENAIVFDGTKRKMKIEGLNIGDVIYMSIGSKGSAAHTFTVTGADANASNPALAAKGDAYVYSDWYFTATATEAIFEVATGGSIIKIIKTGADATGINVTMADQGIIFTGSEIINTKNIEVEVYNMLGKKILNSTSSISTKNFEKGIYFVRQAGTNNVLKFMI